MNTKSHRNQFSRCARTLAALLAGVLVVSKSPAQPATPPVENRFLLIFDTSSEMKKRLPAVQRSLDTLLANNMQGQLRAGDGIGVWTFEREVRPEHLVLQWAPANAAMTASNIIRFVARQHFSGKTSFDALPAYLNRVVQISDRLTVLIFCDGDGEMTGTPFDSGINRFFQQQQAERKKARQPFIVVLRSQLGHYAGCTVCLPPTQVSFPEFPPLPQPPVVPANVPTNAPPPSPPPPVEAPPLIIIGAKPGTNSPPPAPAPPLTTNQPPLAVAVPPANVVANAKSNSPPPAATVKPTNGLAAPPAGPIVPAVTVQPNAMARPQNSGLSSKRALVIGAAFLVLAGVLTVLMLGRARRADHGSLITRSMNKSGKPPT